MTDKQEGKITRLYHDTKESLYNRAKTRTIIGQLANNPCSMWRKEASLIKDKLTILAVYNCFQ